MSKKEKQFWRTIEKLKWDNLRDRPTSENLYLAIVASSIVGSFSNRSKKRSMIDCTTSADVKIEKCIDNQTCVVSFV